MTKTDFPLHQLELYFHIPFCLRKCHYCDFLSASSDELTKDAYMKALMDETMKRSGECAAYRVVSIFIGGGTPSVVKAEHIRELLDIVREHYFLEPTAEITVEVNPGTVDEQKLSVYREAGVNRLSIGLQSALDKELQILGRIHSCEQFLKTYEDARKVGFQNINVDVMSALPGQTNESYRKTLEFVTGLHPLPEHISAYSLILEEGTVLYRQWEEGRITLPEEEAERAMYEMTERFLAEFGYHRYEISNYAREGYECRHNLGYWKRTQYLGFGIGAASLMRECRFRNGDSLKQYLSDPCGCRTEFQQLSEREQMEEFMFLGLRCMKGVSLAAFQKKFTVRPEQVYQEVIEKNQRLGLLGVREVKDDKESDVYYYLTPKGIDLSNQVMADFLF